MVAQLTELKAQLEGQIAVFDRKLNTTEQELVKTQDDLATRSQELVDSQSEVAQLTELRAQLEGQIAALGGKLNTTEEELSQTYGVWAAGAAERENVFFNLQEKKVLCLIVDNPETLSKWGERGCTSGSTELVWLCVSIKQIQNKYHVRHDMAPFCLRSQRRPSSSKPTTYKY
jgi:hypothetical protein